MDDDPRLTAALVLAGGAASRFGSDKTAAELAGRPVLAHVLDAVGAVAGEVLVVGPWAPTGHAHRSEPRRAGGPLVALAFGLSQVAAEWVVVVGGDHPLVRPELLRALVDRAAEGSADAVVPVRDGRDQPLVACYHRRVGPRADALVAVGERSLRALLAVIRVDRVDDRTWTATDPDGRSFLDVDTPEDLEQVRQLYS